ncbi:sensor histidine kinase [Amycolatopsis samaneae]|uniref:histidine kinase n=1 Tax=Amycolatopsis samaneae TaxID=664691 RepID=A0ABW5GBG9_9PSEU
MNRLSLRTRIVLIMITLLAAGLTASDLVVIVAVRGPLMDRVDSQLRLFSLAMARLPEPLRQPTPQPLTAPGQVLDLIDEFYVGLLDERGTVVRLARPGGPVADGGPELERLDTAAVAARGGRPFDDRSGRWRAVVAPRSPGPGSVVVAATTAVDSTVAGVRRICLFVGIGLLLVLAAAGWLWVRAGLRPLRRIEETAAAIAAGDLTSRVPELGRPNTEVGSLARSLNGMLRQVELAVAARSGSEARMRRFVADASHEMRTPLAGISGYAELHRMGALPDAEAVDTTFAHIERESQRLGHLVEDLLLLAQLDESSRMLRLAPLDLRTLAVDAVHDLRALDPAREVEMLESGVTPVRGDEARLRQVVSNLIGNVVAHTPAGSPVVLFAGAVGDRAVLEIRDRGPGLTPEQAARVFERFYRADASRSRTTGGAGLGLSIASSIVTAHHGVLELDSVPGAGATFRVSLPRSPGDTT